jgi:hypothetical protein
MTDIRKLVTVKGLEWLSVNGSPRVFEAQGFSRIYRVWARVDGAVYWQIYYMGEWINAESIEAAKAAAQADYEARILAALQPTELVGELVGVLRALMDLNDNDGPFGGELYRDRVDRAWSRARTTLARMEADQ